MGHMRGVRRGWRRAGMELETQLTNAKPRRMCMAATEK
jgi:hypothetical protein